MNKLLSNILIQRNVISERGIKEIVSHIKNSSEISDLSIFDPEKTNESNKEPKWRTDKDIRNTQTVPIEPIYSGLEELLFHSVKNIVNQFYGINVLDGELPQLLIYKPGGHYRPHVDGESLWNSPDGPIFKKSVDRDLSMIFFLNDGGKDFEGGDLIFPECGIRIRPEKGMLVCFPSNHYFLHGVEPVTKGTRYSIVTWLTVQGFASLEKQNEKLSKKYNIKVEN